MVTSIAAASSEQADLPTELFEGGDPANHLPFSEYNFLDGKCPRLKGN